MTKAKQPPISCRQLCFFCAFLLPVSKLLQAPSLLAYYAGGDLLVPAFLQYLLQGAMLAGLLFLASRWQESIFELISKKLGKVAARVLYLFLAAFYLFFSLLPVLELERFVYTAFFDAAPGVYAFIPFFLLAAYVSTKGLKSFGRCCDLAMPFFLSSFLGLMIMSVPNADFSAILPVFGTPAKSVGLGFLRSLVHFSDTALLLPMLGAYRYQKGDAKKVLSSYALGAGFVLFFLAVFFGTFTTLAPLKSYAFDKIAVYFGALEVVGRIDLLLVYLMTILLLFYYCLPLQLCVECFTSSVGLKTKWVTSAVISALLLLLTVFFNRFYGVLYSLITTKLLWIFPFAAYLVPLFCLVLALISKKKEPKYET